MSLTIKRTLSSASARTLTTSHSALNTTKKLFMPSSYYTDLNRISNSNSNSSGSSNSNSSGSGSNSGSSTSGSSRDKRYSTRDTGSRNTFTRDAATKHQLKPDYILYISATRNNTHAHLSNATTGNTIAQTTAGMLGLKKAARGIFYLFG